MTTLIIGLWVLAGVGAMWVMTLSRILTARREADQRAVEDRWWEGVAWAPLAGRIDACRGGDTVPDGWRS